MVFFSLRRLFLQGSSYSFIVADVANRLYIAVEKKFPGDREKLARMSLIEEGFPKQVRMANLAVVGM